MKILDLVLKKKWFEMIKNGEKHEEYREIKPFWMKRLFKVANTESTLYEKINDECANFYCNEDNHDVLIKDFEEGGIKFKDYTHVRFRCGYTNNDVIFRIKGIRIGKGKKEWGAPDYNVFIIELADKSLKGEFDSLIDDIVRDRFDEYMMDGKVDMLKFGDLYVFEAAQLLKDYSVKFIVNDDIRNFTVKPADEHTAELLKYIR